MNQNSDIELTEAGDGAQSLVEARVRGLLNQYADTVSAESPSVELLRRRGVRRRTMREAMLGIGAVAVVCGVALGLHAADFGAPGRQTVAVGAAPSATSKATGGANTQVGQGDPPPAWQSGPKYQVPTYTSVPSWMKQTSAAGELGAMATRNHNVGANDPPYFGCLTLGSNPLLWPKGFYAEGTPLTVFDPHGRAVYVLDKGFTGADGYPQLGWGDGRLTSGYSLAGCPSAYQEVGADSLLLIFP